MKGNGSDSLYSDYNDMPVDHHHTCTTAVPIDYVALYPAAEQHRPG